MENNHLLRALIDNTLTPEQEGALRSVLSAEEIRGLQHGEQALRNAIVAATQHKLNALSHIASETNVLQAVRAEAQRRRKQRRIAKLTLWFGCTLLVAAIAIAVVLIGSGAIVINPDATKYTLPSIGAALLGVALLTAAMLELRG